MRERGEGLFVLIIGMIIGVISCYFSMTERIEELEVKLEEVTDVAEGMETERDWYRGLLESYIDNTTLRSEVWE